MMKLEPSGDVFKLDIPYNGINDVVEILIRVKRVRGQFFKICDLYILGCANPTGKKSYKHLETLIDWQIN